MNRGDECRLIFDEFGAFPQKKALKNKQLQKRPD